MKKNKNWSSLWAGATWKLGTGRRGEDFVWAGTIHFTILSYFFSLNFWISKNISFKLFVRRINDGTISLMIIASQVEEAVIGGLRPAVIYQVRLLHTLASLEDAPTWNTLCASSKLTLAGQVDPGPLFLPPRPPWQGTHSCLRGDQW